MKYIQTMFLFIVATGCLCAQEVEAPFDIEGKIFLYTAQMEGRLHLFPKYPNLEEARLLRRSENLYILDIAYHDSAAVVHVREERGGAAVAELRRIVSLQIHASAPELQLDHNSRTKFLIWETVLATFAYGPLIMSSIGVNNGSTGAGVELLIGGSGFLVPYALTQNSSMSDAQSSLGLGCAFLGLGHGALIDLALGGGKTGSELGGIMAATSILETFAGSAIASAPGFTEGKSDIIRYGGFFGAGQGMAMAEIAQPGPNAQLLGAAGLAGSGLGFYLGTVLSKDQEYTRGNATVSLTAGLYGPFALIMASEPLLENVNFNQSTGQIVTGILMVGNIGGVLLAHSITNGKRLTASQGNLVLFGTTAGMLIGTGLGYLLTTAHTTTAATFTLPAALGTIAGFYFSYRAFSQNDMGMGSNWDINVNPGTALAAMRAPAGRSEWNTFATPPTQPMLSITYQW